MPSISQIAEKVGVSKSTVSLALNNKPGVSNEMRKKILDASRELSEVDTSKQKASPVSNPLSPPLTAYQTNPYSLLILLPQSLHSDEFFAELLQGIQAAANQYQVQLQMAASDIVLPPNHFTRLLLSTPSLRPSAVLLIAAAEENPLFTEVVRLGIPCATIEDQAIDVQCSSVGANDEVAAMEATEYLLKLGHRRIAVLGGLMNQAHRIRRTTGIRLAMEKAGLELPDNRIFPGTEEEQARLFLKNCPDVTAVIFINQYSTSVQLPVLQAHGKRVPEDLSVITFDETSVARNFNPPLTSVSFPLFHEGFWVVKSLVEQISQPALHEFRLVFNTTIVERMSCKAL